MSTANAATFADWQTVDTDTFRFRDLPSEVHIRIFTCVAKIRFCWLSGQRPIWKLLVLNRSFYQVFAPMWYKEAIFKFQQPYDLVNKFSHRHLPSFALRMSDR